MSGNKKEKLSDLEADFFGGEDLDWLDEDSEVIEKPEGEPSTARRRRKPAPEAAPASPPGAPPPPPAIAGSGVVPRDARGGRSPRPPMDPAELSQANTLVFSQVPTLPPVDASEEVTVAAGRPDLAALRAPSSDLGDEDLPTMSADLPPPSSGAPGGFWPLGSPPVADPPTIPPSSPPTLAPVEDPAEGVFAEEPTGEVPLVRTHDPAPIRMELPGGPREREAAGPTSFTPPVIARPALPPAASSDPAWREVATSMMAEAAAAPGEERGELLFRAGWVYQHELADLYGAESLYRDALNAGCRNPALLRELADLCLQVGRWSEAADLLHERAGLLDAIPAAENLREAGVLYLKKIQQPGAGIGRLQDAVAADPDDYAALTLLREHLSDVQPERADVLERLAVLSDGEVAAEAWYERGHLLEGTRPAEAVDAYRSALAAYPDHGPSFLALEALLARTGDAAGLADLYASEASLDRAGAGWWHALSARKRSEAGDAVRAEPHVQAAVDAGWSFAARERQGRWLARGAWRELAGSLDATSSAHGAYLVGWIRERHLGDLDGAVAAYTRATELDPGAGPAADAARRVLRRKGDHDGLAAFLEGQLHAAPQGRRKLLLFRLGETAEDARRYEDARRWYEAVLEVDPRSISAMAGLGRVLQRLERWAELRALLVRRSEAVEGVDLKAHFLFEAASVGRPAAVDAREAVALHLRALELVPDHLASLDAASLLLSEADRWVDLGRILHRAADASADRRLKIDLYYRAGRVLATRTNELAEARECLSACLELDADFEPALQLSLDLSAIEGDVQRIAAWYRTGASRASDPAGREWAWYAAAVLSQVATPPDAMGAGDLRSLLSQNPSHPGGRALWELVCIARDDLDALADLCRADLADRAASTSAERSRVVVRLADVLLRRGRTEDASTALGELASLAGEGLPLRPAARLARAAGGAPQAAALLARIDEPWAAIERVSLLSRRRKDRDVARAEVGALLASPHGSGLGASLIALRIGAMVEDRELAARGQEGLARGGSSVPMRAACAAWAATHAEDVGDAARAAELYELAMSLRPASGNARLGAFRAHIRLRDAAAVKALSPSAPPSPGLDLDPISVASALVRLGDPSGAIEVLERVAPSAPSAAPVLLHLQRAQEACEEWSGVYRTLLRRLEASRDPSQRAAIEKARRWVLAEKLFQTDEAWALYQQLHAEDPADREVTEALARIAVARGESARAVGFLGELARSAPAPQQAAGYQRRIAEAHLAAGDRGAARQAYLDALDHVPSDPEALAGLRRLATDASDWPGLVQILQRESDLVTGDRKLAVRREIARVTEEKLGQGRVAIDAWRVVLELAPQDTEALGRLLRLAENEREWGVFVETGHVLAALARGAERTTLLRRIGVVCAEHLKRDDAIRYFEQSISEDPPDLEAARRLEEIYRKRSDWKSVTRSLDVQGRVAPTTEEKVAALVRAAKVELETRHDRDAAAASYQRVLKLDPDHEQALRFMASHLFEAGRFSDALPVCERLEPMVERGQDLDDFDTRMELAQFYFYFAEMLRLAGDARAMQRYARALELNPTHLASLEAVGPLYCAAKEWKKAERVYRELLQLSGGQGDRHKVAQTYTQLGLVERALGNPDKAQKRFQKALEVYPNNVDALKGMALLLEDKEDWSQLLTIYNNIIYHATVADDVIDAYMTKGRILDDHMSRPDKAEQHYERSLVLNADQPVALLRMAELAMRRDDYQRAGELADRALKSERPEGKALRPQLLLCVAMARQDAKRHDEALAALAEVRRTPFGKVLAPGALDDLEGLRQLLKENLPRQAG